MLEKLSVKLDKKNTLLERIYLQENLTHMVASTQWLYPSQQWILECIPASSVSPVSPCLPLLSTGHVSDHQAIHAESFCQKLALKKLIKITTSCVDTNLFDYSKTMLKCVFHLGRKGFHAWLHSSPAHLLSQLNPGWTDHTAHWTKAF